MDQSTSPPDSKPSPEQPYDFRMDILELHKVLTEVKGMFDTICNRHSVIGSMYEECRQAALKPIIEFLEDLIEKARPPIVYLMGRSGHGKSSLINALTNNSDAIVGHVKPTTPESVEYDITFKGQNTSWKIVDSRGIFETTIADGAPNTKATEQVENDLIKYKPDIILHVVSCSESRNLEADLKFVKELFTTIKSNFGQVPPVIAVLSKADAFYHPMQWPIEDCLEKQTELQELLEYMSTSILSSDTSEFLDPSAKYYGCKTEGCAPYLYVIPVAALMIKPPLVWNTERLSALIGEKLPLEAWLHFYKTQKRDKIMKQLALKVVNKMAAISLLVGAIPIQGVSTAFLMPLYTIMISLIAKLAGREFSTNTVRELLKSTLFWRSAKAVLDAAIISTLMAMAEGVETSTFGAAALLSGFMTEAATRHLGKTAIAYFFDNEIKEPEAYKKEWSPPTS